MKTTKSCGVFALVAVCAMVALTAVTGPVYAQNNTNQAAPAAQDQPSGFITWRGTVDRTVDVSIQGSRIWTTVIRGKGVLDQEFNVGQPLPQGSVNVMLGRVAGRGTVRIIQDPTAENGYTTVVRIHDGKPGASFYRFSLSWQ